uniref:Slc46a-3 n=1 Tax=Schmidtea mediterranea TaxID=79327 RepID=A0A0H3YFD5_SCHMD|nr:slc46a-3 [Schmidtea mediterranea]
MSTEYLVNEDQNKNSQKCYESTPVEYKTYKTNFRRFFGVEPLLLFYGFASLMQTTVMQQFIYYRVGIIYNITAPNQTLAFVCNRTSGSSDKDKTDKLQEINSHFLMLISLGSSIASILTAPFYSVFSDRYGRRLMFLIPGTGIFVKSVLELLAIYYLWPITTFIYMETFYGLTGAYNFVISLGFSYVADRSGHGTRTCRIAFVGIMIAIGAFVASLSSGYMITTYRYFVPFLASTVAAFLCLIYPLFLMMDSKPISDLSKVNMKPIMAVWKQLTSLATVHKKQSRNESILSILVLIIFAFYNVGEMSGVDLQTPYLMSYPICMTSIQIGLYGILNIVAINLGAGLSTAMLNRCFSDLVVIVLCLIFGMAFNLQMAFATSPLAAFIATGSNLLSFSAFPFFRGFLSKRTKSTEQGALFGGLVLIETVCGAITKVLMLYFYQKTLQTFNGLVFIFIGCFSLVAFILLIFTIPYSHVLDNRKKEKG